MTSPETIQELWALTSSQVGVDRSRLREIVTGLELNGLDSRSRDLLLASRMALAGEDTSHTPFPSLSSRLGDTMKKNTIEQYLRELGTRIQAPATLVIGGSSALILNGLLSRATEDIDIVDEVPQALRDLHEWRDKAKVRYGLYLAHFQSHYLPTGWSSRLHSLGDYGKLSIFLVDPVDIFVGKLFSKREKDLDDLRALSLTLSEDSVKTRLEDAQGLASDEERASQAKDNYYIVFGRQAPL